MIDNSKFNFIDSDSFEKHKLSIFEKYEINKDFYNTNKKFIVLSFIGRLTEGKRLDLIIKLLSRDDSKT